MLCYVCNNRCISTAALDPYSAGITMTRVQSNPLRAMLYFSLSVLG